MMMLSQDSKAYSNGNIMANVKNKSTMYVVLRHDFSGRDVVVACTDSYDRADDLVGEYQQVYLDRGFSEEECYFYKTGTTYYA